MCYWKSGQIRYTRADNSVEALTLLGNDSHNAIREAHGIREATGGLGDGLGDGLTAPAECVPTRGCGPIEDWDFRWDDGKPEWATPEIEERAKLLLWRAAQKDLLLKVWQGRLCVRGNAKLPALTNVTGNLCVEGNVTLPALTNVTGNLRVYGSATLTVPALTSVKGDLDVDSGATLTAPALTSVKGHLRVYGKLDAPKLKVR